MASRKVFIRLLKRLVLSWFHGVEARTGPKQGLGFMVNHSTLKPPTCRAFRVQGICVEGNFGLGLGRFDA